MTTGVKSSRYARRRVRAPRALPQDAGRLEIFFAGRPALRLAYRRAVERYSRVPGVIGFGVGRRFLEEEGRYQPGRETELAIKILVWCKRRPGVKAHRIVRHLGLRVGRGKRMVRVPVDVVSAAPRTKGAVAGRLQAFADDRPWPTAGGIAVGRLFAATVEGVNVIPPGPSYTDLQVELGTAGALVEALPDRSVWAVTSAHVFVQTGAGASRRPADDRAVGGRRDVWRGVVESDFRPIELRVGADRSLRDALAFAVPAGMPPLPNWPPRFRGEFAEEDDIRRAVFAEGQTGFVWVEREPGATPFRIPVDLEAMLSDPVQLLIRWHEREIWIPHAQTWPLRFFPRNDVSQEQWGTLAGDSGAGVYLQENDVAPPRLLGFHFFRWDSGPPPNEGPHSWAVDARAFLESAFGVFGTNFQFHLPT